MQDHPSNLVTGRQLRAARVLADLTQRTLGQALGVDEKQVRFGGRRHNSKPSEARHHALIERALLDHGDLVCRADAGGEVGGRRLRAQMEPCR